MHLSPHLLERLSDELTLHQESKRLGSHAPHLGLKLKGEGPSWAVWVESGSPGLRCSDCPRPYPRSLLALVLTAHIP